jgi:TRAP-type mannitol/chloroaromatic compound transport system substrate-binding protein
MKRREFLKTAGVGMAATAIAAPAIAQSMPEIKWRMPASWPKSLDTLWGGCEVMAKAVAEATDNKFQIQTFAAGEIVPGLAIVDAVQNGTVEIGHSASYYYFGKDPTFAFGTSVAFGPNQRLNQGWYTLGGGKEALDEFYKKYNMVSCRQYRLPDGRLVPQGDQFGRRSQGPQDAHRRIPRPCVAEARWRAATDRRRRHLPCAGKRHA